MKSSTQGNVDPYRSHSTTSTPGASSPSRTRQINDAPVLQRRKSRTDDLGPWTLAKVIAASAAMIHIYLPFFINWIGIVALIFGGCCSNVTYSRQHLGRFDLTRDRYSPWNQSSSECSHHDARLLSLTIGPSDGNQRAVRPTLSHFQLI